MTESYLSPSVPKPGPPTASAISSLKFPFKLTKDQVEAVDACPGFAAIGGFVDAAVFVAVGALLVLDVFDLPAVDAAGGAGGG